MLGYHPLPLNVPDELAEKLRPTLPNLVRHVQRYGLSNKHQGYRGREKTYKNYKAFAKDPAAEVALAYLSEEAYAQFVDLFGPPGTVEAGIADHRAQREGT